MKRPMVSVLAFLVCGILWGSLDLTLPWFFVICIVFFGGGCLFGRFFRLDELVFLPLFMILGFVLSYNAAHPINPTFDSMVRSKEDVTLTGRITDISKKHIVISVKDSSGKKTKVICYTEGSYDDGREILMGDFVSVKGCIKGLNPKYNPSDFDEIQYYGCRGIRYKIFYPDELNLVSHGGGFFYYMWRLREKIGEGIDFMYSAETAGILKAMLLGNKEYLTDDIKTLYKNAGIYHILAISGLHISLIAAGLMLIFRKPKQGIAIIIILFGYCLFTGLSPSTVRAVLMMSVLILGRLLGRKYDLISALCFSAFLLLVVNPMYLKDLSFLYSYGSVFGIAIFASPLSKAFDRLLPFKNSKAKTYLTASIGTSLSAVIITKLFNMWFFYSFTVYDFITNLFVIPFVFIVLLGGAISIVLYSLGIGLWSIPAFCAEFILSYYRIIAQGVNSLPFCSVLTGRPSFCFAFFYIAALIFLGLGLYGRRKSLCLMSLLFISAGIGTAVLPRGDTEIAYLYVGQGDGIIGRSDGTVFTVDGGGTKKEIDEKDEGTYTMLPYLNYIGENKIDYAFVSHIDNDHMKGVYELIGQTDINEIYLPKAEYSSELYDRFTEKAASFGVPIKYMSAGDRIELSEKAYFECIYPFKDMGEIDDVNDTSLVIKFFDGNNSFLFTGDITSEAEKLLLKSNVKADVFKTPHHGSKYSSSREFIEAVSPAFAVISCGKNNLYGFPSEEVKETFRYFHIPYLSTDEAGAVIIKSEPDKIKVKKCISGETSVY